MAEDEFETVGVDLDSIDLREIENAYTKVQAIFAEKGWACDPEGTTRIALVFKGFLDQAEAVTGVCGACIAEIVLHALDEHFRTGSQKGKFH